ncbi:Inosine/uridine-preferring nucleoside hydrolase domain-containing protein [Xylariomycetidae sp. FL0641]|nr:Inosine/uridine-preferring nucleoside hydrolase domain-containing protein [Xylariomycetidae sp. FL0641]
MRFSRILTLVPVIAAAVAKPLSVNSGGPKMIIENDFVSASAGQFLMALDYGYDILGLVGDTSDTWAMQTSMHALALLEVGNLSCIPVYKGSDYPLLMTPKLMQTWQALQGELVWQGVFAPQNVTAEAAGSNPTGGNPDRIIKEAFAEGYPNNTLAGTNGASWMVEQVRQYPGEIVIYSGGALTNLALAVRMDSTFASNVKALYIMGGFVDSNLLQTSGNPTQADINTDFNFKADPEAAHIVMTADFPNITLIAGASNAFFPDQVYRSNFVTNNNIYTRLAMQAASDLPLWDEAAMIVALEPQSVLNQTTFYANVDTSFYSPTYGNVYAYQQGLAPKAQDLRPVNYVYSIDPPTLKSSLKRALQNPKQCA